MDIYEAVPEKTIYAVVDHSQDFINCLCVKTDFDKALSAAFQYASDQIASSDEKTGCIGPIYSLVCDTGYGFDYTHGALRSKIYILRRDAEPGPGGSRDEP